MNSDETIAVVTGGASGLGEAAVREICGRGGKAAIFDRDAERGTEVAGELGENALFCEVDVTDETSVMAGLDAAVRGFGGINACINCAGIAIGVKTTGKDGAHPLDAYRRVIDINLVGTFNVTRLAALRIAESDADSDGQRGVIVNTASVAAFDGQKGQAAYAASKGGVAASTLPLARDLAFSGIRVCTIAPGLFLTPMFEGSITPEAQELLAADVTFPKRLGRPREFAKLVCAIIENPYLNGETIRLDGAIRLP